MQVSSRVEQLHGPQSLDAATRLGNAVEQIGVAHLACQARSTRALLLDTADLKLYYNRTSIVAILSVCIYLLGNYAHLADYRFS